MRAEADPPRNRHGLPRGFGVIWTTVVIDLIGFGIALPVLGPFARNEFGSGGATVGLLLASYSLAQFVFAPVLGRASDRFGRRPVLILSLAGTTLSSLATGWAGALWVLFLARTLDGVSGASTAVAQAAVADLAEPEHRAHLLGLIGAAFGIGFTIGPAIGGLAAWLGGPRAPFFVAAAIAGANTVAAVARLPETRTRRPPGRIAVGARPLGARSWRDADLPVLIGLAGAGVLAFSAFEATFALFGADRLGFSDAAAGGAFAIAGLMVSAVQGGLVRRVIPAHGETTTMRIGFAATAVGLGVLAVTHSWPVLLVALAGLCVGQGLTSPSLTSATVSRAAADRRGAVLGAQQSVQALARVGGPVLGGFAYEHLSIGAPSVIGAGLCACAAVATLRLQR